MSAHFEMVVTADELRFKMKRLAEGLRGQELLESTGQYMSQTALPKRFRVGGPGWAPVRRGGQPLRDTGALMKSFGWAIEDGGRSVVVRSAVPYAGPQHRGDTIRPKRGKYLAIPLSPPLSVSQRRTKGPRDFTDTRIFKSKAGHLLVWKNFGSKKDPNWKPIFLLKTSVKLTARPFMFFADEDLDAIRRRAVQLVAYWIGAKPVAGEMS